MDTAGMSKDWNSESKAALVILGEKAATEPEDHNIWTNSGFRVAVEKIKV